MTTKSTASTWLKPTKSISEIISERVEEVANRLVAPGPKAAHVSASECHEITDAIRAMRRIITGTIPARAYYPYDLVRAVSDAEQRERERLRRRVENALAFAHPGKSKDFNDGYVEAVTDALDAFPPVGKVEPEVQLNSASAVELVDGKWKRVRDLLKDETHVVVPVAFLEEISKLSHQPRERPESEALRTKLQNEVKSIGNGESRVWTSPDRVPRCASCLAPATREFAHKGPWMMYCDQHRPIFVMNERPLKLCKRVSHYGGHYCAMLLDHDGLCEDGAGSSWTKEPHYIGDTPPASSTVAWSTSIIGPGPEDDGEPECEHGVRLTLNDCEKCSPSSSLDKLWCVSPKCARRGSDHEAAPGCPAWKEPAGALTCPDCDKATEPARFWCGTCEKFWSNGYDKPNPSVVHNLMQAAKPIVEHIRSALARPVMLAMLAPFDIEIFERFLGAYKQVERESELPKDKSK